MCLFNARPQSSTNSATLPASNAGNSTQALSNLASQMGTTAAQMYGNTSGQNTAPLTSGFMMPNGQVAAFGSNYGAYGQQAGNGHQQLDQGLNQLMQSMMSLLAMVMQTMMSMRGHGSSNSLFGAQSGMNAMNLMNALFQGQSITPNQPMAPGLPTNPGQPGHCGGYPTPAKPWTVEQNGQKGTVNLGDKYKLELNEADMSWKLTNNETGKCTRVWGDPHVDELGDGSNDWDFKKDASFMLDDGTKITVNNAGDEKGLTLSSKLTITNTRSNQAVVVSGLAGGTDGANNLKIDKRDGQAWQLDAATADGGLLFAESKDGRWRFADNGADVNQTEVNSREAKAGSNLWTTNKDLFK